MKNLPPTTPAVWLLHNHAGNKSCVYYVDWQRRQWLSEAIDSLQGSDPVKSMLRDIQVVLSTDDDSDYIEKKAEALENLQLHAEDVDLANGFVLILI